MRLLAGWMDALFGQIQSPVSGPGVCETSRSPGRPSTTDDVEESVNSKRQLSSVTRGSNVVMSPPLSAIRMRADCYYRGSGAYLEECTL